MATYGSVFIQNYSDLIHFHVNIAETLPYIYEYNIRIAGCQSI